MPGSVEAGRIFVTTPAPTTLLRLFASLSPISGPCWTKPSSSRTQASTPPPTPPPARGCRRQSLWSPSAKTKTKDGFSRRIFAILEPFLLSLALPHPALPAQHVSRRLHFSSSPHNLFYPHLYFPTPLLRTDHSSFSPTSVDTLSMFYALW